MADKKISSLTNMSGVAAIDRAADFIEISDTSGPTSYKATPNFILGITGDPVGTTDTQALTNKTVTAPAISSPVLSGTITGTYTIGGTPTFPSAVVTLTGSQTLTNKVLTSPTINTATIVNPTLLVDAISEFTGANGVTIDGLNIKDGKLNTNDSVVTTNITNDAVDPTKWTNPYCFRAYDSGGTTLTDNTAVKINLATESYDFSSNFATSTYTVPVNGVYHLSAGLISSAIATHVSANIRIYKNGAVIMYAPSGNDAAGYVANISGDVLLATSDTIELYFFQNSAGSETTITGSDATWMSGHLVHPT